MLLSSCATIFFGTKQKVKLVSEPAGASVYLNGRNLNQTTPCTVTYKRKQHSTNFNQKNEAVFVFKKDKYQDKEFRDLSRLNPLVFLDLSAGIVPIAAWASGFYSATTAVFFIPGIVDFASGASRLYSKDITVKLEEVQPTIDSSRVNKATPAEITKRNANEESKEIYASPVDFSVPGKFYAILMGVSDYRDPNIPDLDSLPIKDAMSLGKVLRDRYAFDKENIVSLYNPTRRDIVTALTEASKKITPNDNLLIFYAGHGHYETENDIGYWLPVDAETNNPSNWLYNDQLVADLKKIKSLHTLLLSDACFSGSIFKTRSVNMQDASSFVKQKYQLPSRKAITSGTLKTVPNRSAFMKYLLDRLKNNNEKYFSASQLFRSIEEPVSNNSSSLPQFGVIQNVGDEGGDFIFIKR